MNGRARVICAVLSGLCMISMLWLGFGGSTVTYEDQTLSTPTNEKPVMFTVDCNPVTWGLLRNWTSGSESADNLEVRSGYSISDGGVPGAGSDEVAGRCEQVRSGKAGFMALLAVPAAVLGTAATRSGRREPRDARTGRDGTIGSGSA